MDETAPEGQQWAADRIAGGDEECAANQRLRLQNPDLVAEIHDNPFYTAELGDPLAPRTFVDRIDVPVFLAGAWQDEQTGGRFATMLDRFHGTEHFYASLVNGLHTESIGSTAIFARFVEFLDLYVAERVPSLDAASAVAPGPRRRDLRHRPGDPAARPLHRPDLRAGAGDLRVRAADPGAVRGRRGPAARCRARPSRGGSSRSTRGRCRRRRRRGTSGRTAWRPNRRRTVGGTSSYTADPDGRPADVLRRGERVGVGLRRDVGLAPAARRDGGLVHQCAAARRHRRRRLGFGGPVDPYRTPRTPTSR